MIDRLLAGRTFTVFELRETKIVLDGTEEADEGDTADQVAVRVVREASASDGLWDVVDTYAVEV